MSADNVSYLCEDERPTAHYTLPDQKKNDGLKCDLHCF